MAVNGPSIEFKPTDIPVPGVTRIVCPRCRKPTRSHLGSGWAFTWCKKCRLWYRTAKEMLTPDLMSQPPFSIPADLQGLMRIVCPHCHKPTRSYLGCGWTVTWCNKCRMWFRTTNEVVTPHNPISIPTETEKESND